MATWESNASQSHLRLSAFPIPLTSKEQMSSHDSIGHCASFAVYENCGGRTSVRSHLALEYVAKYQESR